MQYEGITETIDEFGDTEKYDVKIYANITGAIKYAYYSGESAALSISVALSVRERKSNAIT